MQEAEIMIYTPSPPDGMIRFRVLSFALDNISFTCLLQLSTFDRGRNVRGWRFMGF